MSRVRIVFIFFVLFLLSVTFYDVVYGVRLLMRYNLAATRWFRARHLNRVVHSAKRVSVTFKTMTEYLLCHPFTNPHLLQFSSMFSFFPLCLRRFLPNKPTKRDKLSTRWLAQTRGHIEPSALSSSEANERDDGKSATSRSSTGSDVWLFSFAFLFFFFVGFACGGSSLNSFAAVIRSRMLRGGDWLARPSFVRSSVLFLPAAEGFQY